MELLQHWAQNANIAMGLPLYSRGVIEYFAIIAPVCIGTLYFIVKWVYFKIALTSTVVGHDPRPARVWYTIAILNVLVLFPLGWVPVSVGVFLLVLTLYIWNNDFGTSF